MLHKNVHRDLRYLRLSWTYKRNRQETKRHKQWQEPGKPAPLFVAMDIIG